LEAAANKSIVLVCGICETKTNFPLYEVIKKAPNKEEALQNASQYLFEIGKELASTILSNGKI
jgi:hypothetical protein